MIPLPASCEVCDVATWLVRVRHNDDGTVPTIAYANDIRQADAVVGLLYAKVREAITAARVQERSGGFTDDDTIVSRVLGGAK